MSSSSSSSSPRETYEEDREYESQAKRLKTEEGEIDYSAEEGETRREATPRGGGDGGGSGRSFSQPVTKRCQVLGAWSGPGGQDSAPGPLARLVYPFCCADRWEAPALWLLFFTVPASRIPTAGPAQAWPQAPLRVGSCP